MSEVWSLKSEVWSLKSEVWSLKSEVWSLKSEVWSLKSEVWSLKSLHGFRMKQNKWKKLFFTKTRSNFMFMSVFTNISLSFLKNICFRVTRYTCIANMTGFDSQLIYRWYIANLAYIFSLVAITIYGIKGFIIWLFKILYSDWLTSGP
jgi:hypothetical protein